MNEFETKFAEVFHDVFENPAIVVHPEMTAKDIPAWDSLMHIQLIVAVERAFGVRFAAGEVEKLQNVGEMIRLIALKKGGS